MVGAAVEAAVEVVGAAVEGVEEDVVDGADVPWVVVDTGCSEVEGSSDVEGSSVVKGSSPPTATTKHLKKRNECCQYQ